MTPAVPRIALTTGDPHGIGPEVLLRALAADHPQPFDPLVFGPLDAVERAAEQLDVVFEKLSAAGVPVDTDDGNVSMSRPSARRLHRRIPPSKGTVSTPPATTSSTPREGAWE